MRSTTHPFHLLLAASALALALATLGCTDDSPDDGGGDAACGQGESFDYGGDGYCLYGSGILEEGFTCPAEFSQRRDFDGFTACGPPGDGGFGDGFEDAARDHGDFSAEPPGNNDDPRNNDVTDNNDVPGDCASITDIVACDDAPDCRWAVPGCSPDDELAEVTIPEATCLPAGDLDGGTCEDGACPTGYICAATWEDPCAPRPDDEAVCGACGSEATLCVPDTWLNTDLPADCEDGSCCANLDEDTCEAASQCAYHFQGCDDGANALPANGCYPAQECASDADCPASHLCQADTAVLPECAISDDPNDPVCAACADIIGVCVPE